MAVQVVPMPVLAYAYLVAARQLLHRKMRPGDRGEIHMEDVIVEAWHRLGNDPPRLVSSSSTAPKPPAAQTTPREDDAESDRFALLELDPLPAKAGDPTAPVQGVAGEVTTTTTAVGSYAPAKESKTEQLQPQVFREEPAIVQVSLGRTVNLGNYESARVDVSIRMPCAPADAAATYTRVRDDVQARLLDEVERLRRR